MSKDDSTFRERPRSHAVCARSCARELPSLEITRHITHQGQVFKVNSSPCNCARGHVTKCANKRGICLMPNSDLVIYSESKTLSKDFYTTRHFAFSCDLFTSHKKQPAFMPKQQITMFWLATETTFSRPLSLS